MTSRTPLFRATWLAMVCCLPLAMLAARPARVDTLFTVNSTRDDVDANPGDGVCATALGDCTLRAAIQEANALPGTDTILLPAGTFNLTRAGAHENAAATGDLDITEAVSVQGAGLASTFIDGIDLDRIFHIAGGVPVSISNLTISSGIATTGTGDPGNGGGVYIEAAGGPVTPVTITLTDVFISACKAARDGGGIAVDAANTTVVLTRSTVAGCEALARDAGAIGMFGAGHCPLTLIDSLIDENAAARDSGGIQVSTGSSVLTLTRTVIGGNRANNQFGGVEFDPTTGSIEMVDSAIQFNTSSGPTTGGLFFAPSSGSVSLLRSTVSNNRTNGDGGGILFAPNLGDLTIEESEISGNFAGRDAGGILMEPGSAQPGNSRLRMVNCTISGNEAERDGGGIINRGATVSLHNVTVTLNLAETDVTSLGGGGLANLPPRDAPLGTFSLLNTIVAGNEDRSGRPDLLGSFVSNGHNLLGVTTGAIITGTPVGNIIGQDPQLGPLADNGGPTLTHALLPGSPAIDTADNDACPATDQRLIDRPLDGDGNGSAVCDIGAFERSGGAAVGSDLSVTMTDSPDPVQVGGTLVYTILVRNNGPEEAALAELRNTLPDSVTFLSADPAPDVIEGTFLRFPLFSIPNGAVRTVVLRVRPNAPATITNTAEAFNKGGDPNPANNTAAEATVVQQPQDNEGPTITNCRIVTPASRVLPTAGGPVTIEADVSDPSGVAAVEARLTRAGSSEIITAPMTLLSGTRYRGVVTVTPEVEDRPLVYDTLVIARDTLDNETSESCDPVTVPAPEEAGGTLSLSAGRLAFGDICLGNFQARRLVISNSGEGLLTGSLAVSGGAFQIVGSRDFSVEPGKKRTLTVRFIPRAEQTYTRTLTITSSDPSRPTATVTLTGKGCRRRR